MVGAHGGKADDNVLGGLLNLIGAHMCGHLGSGGRPAWQAATSVRPEVSHLPARAPWALRPQQSQESCR